MIIMKDKQRSQDIGAGVRDGILRVLLASGALGAALIAPNIILFGDTAKYLSFR